MVTVSFTGMVSSTFLICWLEYYFMGAGHYNLVSSTCAFLLLSYLRSILDFSRNMQRGTTVSLETRILFTRSRKFQHL